jgi:23S rRNA pseudouridine2605 synthase
MADQPRPHQPTPHQPTPPQPTPALSSPPLSTGDRLQKVLARAGIGSRRTCEELIVEGRVTVNGEVPVLGRRVDPAVDQIELDGVPLPLQPGLVHYLLNKPPGVVSTAEDTHGRQTVISLVPETPRVFPVGRLDMDSEGLLILTNDGQLTHRLTHPSFGVPKEYLVHVEGAPTPGEIARLRNGVDLEDGPTAPAQVAVVSPDLIRIVIHEGRNRQVRRMCEAVGHPVRRLVRTRIGPIADPALRPGSYRKLSFDEVRSLAAAAVAIVPPSTPSGGPPGGPPGAASGGPPAAASGGPPGADHGGADQAGQEGAAEVGE